LFLIGGAPQFAEYLDQYPRAPISEVESFIYWSKERLDGKAIISATHVSILRSTDNRLPDALVAGKGIFATHYVNASLGLTALMRGRPGSPNYLAYVNRSDVDVLGGLFGGLVRVFMERRLKKEASTVLLGLRQRLESGDPESQGARFNSGSGTAGFPAARPPKIRGAPFARWLVQEQVDCLRDNGSRRQPTRRHRYCPFLEQKGSFMKSPLRLMMILALVVMSGLEVPAQTPATGRLMRLKLAHSQKILEAILTSDFTLLDRESTALAQTTKSPAWSVLYSPEYIRQSGAFLRALDDLRDAAKGMDLEGAASSYVSLTLTCFQCHRYMKNKRIATR
jgi:hypothetical protein